MTFTSTTPNSPFAWRRRDCSFSKLPSLQFYKDVPLVIARIFFNITVENSLCPLYLKYPTPEKDLALALQNWGNHKNVIPRSKELSALRWECLLLAETETPSHFETVNTPASYPYSSHKTRHQVLGYSGNSVTEPGVFWLFSSALLLILQLEIFSKNFLKKAELCIISNLGCNKTYYLWFVIFKLFW